MTTDEHGTPALQKAARHVPKDTPTTVIDLREIAADIRATRAVKHNASHDEHEFLGFCMMDLGDRIQKDEWVWNAVDLDAGEIRQKMIRGDATKKKGGALDLKHSTEVKDHSEPHATQQKDPEQGESFEENPLAKADGKQKASQGKKANKAGSQAAGKKGKKKKGKGKKGEAKQVQNPMYAGEDEDALD